MPTETLQLTIENLLYDLRTKVGLLQAAVRGLGTLPDDGVECEDAVAAADDVVDDIRDRIASLLALPAAVLNPKAPDVDPDSGAR